MRQIAPSPPPARHYHPTLSIWLSVDPMADKYPSTSPYVYCGNNPVRLVDPDGRDIWIVGEDGNKYKYSQGQLFDKMARFIHSEKILLRAKRLKH